MPESIPKQQDQPEIPRGTLDPAAASEAATAAASAIARNPNLDVDQREPRKPAVRILEQQIRAGLEVLRRPTLGLLMASLSAGLELGFSVLAMGVIISLDDSILPVTIKALLIAGAYAIGFVLVILGRSELFTEQTALAVLPVIHQRGTIRQLLRTWGLIYSGNLVGGAIFALMAAEFGPTMGVIQPSAFAALAHRTLDHPGHIILLSAVLAGWLMALLSWLVTAARDTTAQIIMIFLITTTIGLAHLHHVIAGSIEVLAAMFANQGISPLRFLEFLFWATLGNSIGGVFFVAVIKYAHVIQSGEDAKELDKVQ